MNVKLIEADMREALSELGCLVDAVVTDPPYHLTSIVKRFGAEGAAPLNNADTKAGVNGPFGRTSAGFMGKQWDGGDIAFRPETWRAVYDVMKPGAHLVAFGGTRTFHRMACAIEDAGFEIRDTLMWLYGTGFPKSHDVSKGIDKMLGAEREVLAEGAPVKRMIPGADQNATGSWVKDNGRVFVPQVTAPGSSEAAEWEGWGTALKPAWEPIILARKPLAGTVAANVLAHRTGALNIDGCRIRFAEGDTTASADSAGQGAGRATANHDAPAYGKGLGGVVAPPHALGRWPANVLHDGSDEVEAAFAAFGEKTSGSGNKNTGNRNNGNTIGHGLGAGNGLGIGGDTGSASRFFYSAKASAADRAGSKHPTVKPIALMRWLVRLITPPGGTVLDPFAGSGTTGAAAIAEGMSAVLIEREAEYQADIRRRFQLSEAAADVFG